MGLWNTILDIVFPAKCSSCGESGADLCIKCLADSPEALRESENWIFPLFDYRHPAIKDAIWLLKYKGKKKLAEVFAEVMYGRILEELSELSITENFREPFLVPIPLSGKRYRERGFNQALLIARKLMELDKDNKSYAILPDILIKPRETIHQARIENRSERLKNIIGSFSVRDTEENLELIKGKNIILIDDVTTTGATLKEARKVMKQYGAKKVIAFTVAH